MGDDLIYRIKSILPIESVIAEYVQLKKAGRNLKGLCPFHDEKTPSFHVSPDKGFYHCFGCKASGDIIKFVEEIEHVTFPEALEILAEKAGIDISQYKQFARSEVSEQIINANEQAAIFYNNELKYAPDAFNYLVNRGLTKRQIDKFRLGYAKQGNNLVKYINNKKMQIKDFEAAGLVVKSGESYRGRFYNRIMFPISDSMGRIIGFGGRTMDNNGPKYINSAENPVFKKGYYLYGLEYSKKNMRKDRIAILTEGYMDFISLFNAGIDNCAAQLGTACTPMQAKLLSRVTEKVVLMYDSDEAGLNAALRSIPILLKEGLAVDVFQYNGHKDPDELIKANQSVDKDYIYSGSMDFISFAIKFHSKDIGDKLLRKKHIINYAAECIKDIPDNALKSVYIDIAERDLKMDRNMLKKSDESSKQKPLQKMQQKVNTGTGIYSELIAMMLSDSEIAVECCQYIDDDEYYDLKTKGIFVDICNHLAEKSNYNIDNIINNDNIKDYDNEIKERIMYYSSKKIELKKARKLISLIQRDGVQRNLQEVEIKKKHTTDEDERDRLDQLSILLQKKLKKGGISND